MAGGDVAHLRLRPPGTPEGRDRSARSSWRRYLLRGQPRASVTTVHRKCGLLHISISDTPHVTLLTSHKLLPLTPDEHDI